MLADVNVESTLPGECSTTSFVRAGESTVRSMNFSHVPFQTHRRCECLLAASSRASTKQMQIYPEMLTCYAVFGPLELISFKVPGMKIVPTHCTLQTSR